MVKSIDLSQKLNRLADNKVVLSILWVTLVLLRLPFVDKGIDYTDTGFSLTNYMLVFSGFGIDGIGTFVTKLIGGIIYEILPAYQLLVFRAIFYLMCVATDVCAYFIFREYLKPATVLIALIAHSFFSLGGESMYSYYPLTKLVLVIAIWLILKGIKSNKCLPVFFSGLLCGVNVFVRLPNVLFCVMIVAIIFYGIWTKSDKKTIIKQSLYYFFGAVIGFVVVLISMTIYMGIENVVNSFMSFVNMALGKPTGSVENFLGIEETGGHSVFDSIKTIAVQGFFGLKDMCIYGAPMLIIAFVFTIIAKKCPQSGKVVCGCVGLVLEIAFIVIFKTQVRANLMYVSAVVMMALSLFMIFALKGKSPQRRVIYLLMFALGVCSVFGSDLGLNRINMLQGMISLTMLMSISDMQSLEIFSDKHIKSRFVYKNIVAVGVALILLCELVTGITVNTQSAYMDSKYSQMNAQVDERINVLKGMKTSQLRAQQINEYYEVMAAPEFKDSQVAVFGYFPLGYVIGPQRDYFEEVQPCVDYPAVSVVSLLTVIEEKKDEGIYPIIVISHINKIQRGDDHDTSDAKLAVIDYMLTLTDYEVYLDDENFLIYVPSEVIQP